LFPFLKSFGLEGAFFQVASSSIPLWGDFRYDKPVCVKGIHLTAWVTGSKKSRKEIEELLATTELNTVVIAVKDMEGEIYIPGVNLDPNLFVDVSTPSLKPYRSAMPDIANYLTYLKERGIFTIARVVVFSDQILPKVKPEWAVQSSTPMPLAVEKGFQPGTWVDVRGRAWVDPYREEVQNYVLAVAERAAQLGFQGIQFDYIRFPADGKTNHCLYSQPHSSQSGPKALSQFLKKAKEKLELYNVEISIDTFGFAGTKKDDLGIGQKISTVIEHIDVLSPMLYPSHYSKGNLGISEPNKAPYEIVARSIRDTMKVLDGTNVQLRPYLQDFSLGVKYRAEEVRAQIEAAMDQGIREWLLWNPRSRYTKDALLPKNTN